MSSFQKKSAGIVASVLISVMVLGFIFSGFYGGSKMGASSDAVASVDGTPIRAREFEISLRQQLSFLQSMMGGKEITHEMMEQFGIKQQVLSQLISQKMMLNLSNKWGLSSSAHEVKDRIEKELKNVFKDKPFDVDTYKQVLKSNGLNPQEFEMMIADEIKLTQLSQILQQVPISHSYAKEIAVLKGKELELEIVELEKSHLEKFIPVSAQEIATFLKDTKNKQKVENYFSTHKESLSTPEKVKVRHILISTEQLDEAKALEKITNLKKEITSHNFAEIAKKSSDDPSAKENAGELGWMSKGQMVPEFEEKAFELAPGVVSDPVKTQFGYHLILVEEKAKAHEAQLSEHQDSLAKELIQKEKLQDLQHLSDSLAKNFKEAMDKNDETAINKLAEQYQLNIEKNAVINPLSSKVQKIIFTPEMLEKMFTETPHEGKKVFQFNEITKVILVKGEFKRDLQKMPLTSEEIQKSADKEITLLKRSSAKEFEEEVMKGLKDKTKVKVFKEVM